MMRSWGTNVSLFVLGTVSATCVLSGALMAHACERYPACAKDLEILGGLLLAGGVALLGAGLSPIAEAVIF
jgi:hypothetical protein